MWTIITAFLLSDYFNDLTTATVDLIFVHTFCDFNSIDTYNSQKFKAVKKLTFKGSKLMHAKFFQSKTSKIIEFWDESKKDL